MGASSGGGDGSAEDCRISDCRISEGSGIWDLGSGIWDLGSGICNLGSEIGTSVTRSPGERKWPPGERFPRRPVALDVETTALPRDQGLGLTVWTPRRASSSSRMMILGVTISMRSRSGGRCRRAEEAVDERGLGEDGDAVLETLLTHPLDAAEQHRAARRGR